MHTLIVFDSQFGNTQKIAEAIAAELAPAGQVDMLNVRGGAAATAGAFPEGIDLLLVGGPTQVHGVTATLSSYIEGVSIYKMAGTPAAAFDTRVQGWPLLTGEASRGIAKRLKRHGARMIVPPESFIVTGREGPLMEGELERARAWAQRVLAAAEATGSHAMAPA